MASGSSQYTTLHTKIFTFSSNLLHSLKTITLSGIMKSSRYSIKSQLIYGTPQNITHWQLLTAFIFKLTFGAVSKTLTDFGLSLSYTQKLFTMYIKCIHRRKIFYVFVCLFLFCFEDETSSGHISLQFLPENLISIRTPMIFLSEARGGGANDRSDHRRQVGFFFFHSVL